MLSVKTTLAALIEPLFLANHEKMESWKLSQETAEELGKRVKAHEEATGQTVGYGSDFDVRITKRITELKGKRSRAAILRDCGFRGKATAQVVSKDDSGTILFCVQLYRHRSGEYYLRVTMSGFMDFEDMKNGLLKFCDYGLFTCVYESLDMSYLCGWPDFLFTRIIRVDEPVEEETVFLTFEYKNFRPSFKLVPRASGSLRLSEVDV